MAKFKDPYVYNSIPPLRTPIGTSRAAIKGQRSIPLLPTPVNISPAFHSGPRSVPLLPTSINICSASHSASHSIPLLPTTSSINVYPASNIGNLNYDRGNVYQNSEIYQSYNNNFITESFGPKSEIHFNSFDSNPYVPCERVYNNSYCASKPMDQKLGIHCNSTDTNPGNSSEPIDNNLYFTSEPVDPKLDFCTNSFDPIHFLNQPYNIVKNILPFPKAKEYNNLAEYYSHHILKKDNSKRVEKDRLYDRDYAWYYKILGWDKKIQQRYEQRITRRTRKYAGWLTAKLRKYRPRFGNDPNYEPCRSFPPLQSTKIIQTQSKLRKYKIYQRNVAVISKKSTTENLEINTAEKSTLTETEKFN